MESANFHDQQQEDNQFLVDSSCYGLSGYQNHILNGTRYNTITNSSDLKQRIYHDVDRVPNSQDLGLTSISIENFNAHELQHLARIKQKLSVTGSYSETRNIINCSPTSSTTEELMSNNNIQRTRYINDNNQDMLLKTYSDGCHIKSDQFVNQIPSSEESLSMIHSFESNSCYRGTFSQIFPTLNVSNLNQTSSSLDINLQALDSFGSTTFHCSSSYQPSAYNAHNHGGLFKDSSLSYDVEQMNRKVSFFLILLTETKRPASDYMHANGPKASPTKKSKLEFRPSCTPLKIRKEKLGDRISALQQMVAPFGK
ncbi:transcription factor bHLH110-like, partial [Bidens hawaiensis]|uniref:transcription factor bHLH110-like n=1 Tax=Bidens hawaiensis TaxID=980011 RepID=UPI00404AC44E